MPAKPELFDPFIERVAGRTADLVLRALKPELLRPAPPPVAVVAPDDEKTASGDDAVYKIDQFCERNQISRASLYKLWQAELGPKYFKVGAATQITGQAEREWRLACEG